MKNKIFVTGCAGMIGSSICNALVEVGHSVIGLDNLWRGTSDNMAGFFHAPNFEFRHADIASDQDWFRDMDAQSRIVHTADIVGGIGYVFQNEWSVFQKNILINTQIARVLQQVQPEQLIYLGTACSYPQSMQRSTDTSVLKEDDKYPADPESGYGWSKLLGDIEFHLAAKGTGSRLTVLDLHNVYGWPCVYDDKTSQVMPALIYKSLTSTDGTLTVWGDGTQGRAFVHVTDVVQAVVKSLTYAGTETNMMIGPENCTQIRQLAELIMSHPRINLSEIRYDTTKPTGDIGRFANAARARRELSWQPSVDLKDGVFDLIDRVSAHFQSNSR